MKTKTKTNRPAAMDNQQPLVPLELSGEIAFTAARVESESEGPTLPTFHLVAYTGDVMTTYFGATIVDMDGLKIGKQKIPVRYQHSAFIGVGHTTSVRVENGKLLAEGVVSRNTREAQDIVSSGKNGFPWQASIGAMPIKLERLEEGVAQVVNGRTVKGPCAIVRSCSLLEISFVDLGADLKTSAKIAATHGDIDMAKKTGRAIEASSTDERTEAVAEQERIDAVRKVCGGKHPEIEASAIEEGWDETTTRLAVAEARIEAMTAAATREKSVEASQTGSDPCADIRREAAAECRRIAAIRKLCDGQHPDIEANAIEGKWSETKTELEVLRASRVPVRDIPGNGCRADHALNSAVLEAAVLMAGNYEHVEQECDEKALDLAAKTFRRGISLQELLLEAARANGFAGRGFRGNERDVLRHAFDPGLRASFSTVDIAGILSNVSNKFLLEGFNAVEQTWREVAVRRSVNDFKTVTSYRLVGDDQYELVAPGGDLKHGTLDEKTYTNRADTYGKLLSITRKNIIDDDLGAITTVPRKLGRGSGLKINDVLWKAFLDNATFFAAGENNYIEGSDTALGIEGLTKAAVKFMEQTDTEGKPLGIMPAILLVPPALQAIAKALFASTEIRDTTSSTKFPVANPHAGMYRALMSAYLSNSAYTGYSAKAWYLLANPADLAVLEIAFLNGQEAPTIETADADFSVLGIQMRGYHDFGVAKVEPKGGVKSKGEA